MINKLNTEYYKWGNNCQSWVFHETEDLSIKFETMPPNTSEELHCHNKAQQFFFVLSGVATFYLEGVKENLKAHEGISVLPNQKHLITNDSEFPLEILVISQPNADLDRETKTSELC